MLVSCTRTFVHSRNEKRQVKVTKIGRNDACPCGSGNKFKKCCASRNVTVPTNASNIKPPEKSLVKTLTDEFFQPMRLYYTIHDKQALECCLKHLKCMLYNENLNDWVVNYAAEAANMKLKVPPSKVPKKARPLIIATIYIDNEHAMLIDVRSIERAAKMIAFIDQYIPKKVAEITHTAIYNKLITVAGDDMKSVMDIDYDDIFNQKNVTVIDPEESIQESNDIAAQYEDKKERLEVFCRQTEDKAKKPLPTVEKFPVHYYEDGIDSFKTTCSMRQMIAMQHYLGHEDFSFYDLIQELAHKNIGKSQGKAEWLRT